MEDKIPLSDGYRASLSNCMSYTARSAGDKKIVWLQPSNSYLLLEISAYTVFKGIMNRIDHHVIGEELSVSYDLPPAEALRYVEEIAVMIEKLSGQTTDVSGMASAFDHPYIAGPIHSLRHYKINGQRYAVEYATEHLENLVHPKFAYLECNAGREADHTFQLFQKDGQSVLRVNGEIIGHWLPDLEHYLSGKISMELVNRTYHKNEADWMGVFHASAISSQNKCLMFAGDSGSGKSTICAILMAAGFNLVADDFIPVDGLSGRVYPFPAALSVKKSALAPLMKLFPGLAEADEFSYPAMEKTVRYLPPELQPENFQVGYPCKALVFVSYKEHSGMTLETLSKEISFQKLIPDSWISPLEANAERFLDWFLDLPCYQLTYSNSEEMVIAIQKLFNDDL